MSWKPIVASVDLSAEGMWAAALAWKFASAAGTTCHLVHVTADVKGIPIWVDTAVDIGELKHHLTAATEKKLKEHLSGNIPTRALEQLEVVFGKPGWTLPTYVQERDAILLILGGKHLAAPTQWFDGSTVHDLVRTADVPVLIAIQEHPEIKRVLVGLDFSYAAAPTFVAAARLATLFDAELRVIHAVERLPEVYGYPVQLDNEQHFAASREQFYEMFSGLGASSTIDLTTVQGTPDVQIAQEATKWPADLVVVGSHGKGWIDRLLIGSVAQRLLNQLPASLLVVPVGVPEDGNTEPARIGADAASW